VLVGKYLGIILSAGLAVGILGAVLCLTTWWRIPSDYMINTHTLDDRELQQLFGTRVMHLSGLIPSLIMVWLQISTLAAIGVALSTRFSLVVNLPVVIFLYIAGNLTRFLYPLTTKDSPFSHQGWLVKGIAASLRAVLPYLEAFDLKARTIHSKIAVQQFASDPGAVHLSQIWGYLGLSVVYGVAFTAFALSVGMWLFQTRELGGAEG
jgi:hypothetical protein